jgi:hypothetical protein
MHQEIITIIVTREHHVFLLEAHQSIPTEEAKPIEPMTNKQAME